MKYGLESALERLALVGCLVTVTSVPNKGYSCHIHTEKPPFIFGRATAMFNPLLAVHAAEVDFRIDREKKAGLYAKDNKITPKEVEKTIPKFLSQ